MKAFQGPQETLVPTEGVEAGIDPSQVERVITPKDSRYLVRLDPPMDRSRGGIMVPDVSIPQSRSGVVIKAGLGALSDDGKTRMPMVAKPGDRVLFEYAAGYSIPRVPHATTAREKGYKLVGDGSILAVIKGSGKWPEFPDDADAVVPRLALAHDWLLVQNDAVQQVHKLAMPGRALTPAERAGKRVRVNGRAPVALHPSLAGRVLVLPTQGSQVEGAERWTGVVRARGPGMVSMTRCLDGDRVGRSTPMCGVGDRVLYTTEFPFMSLPGIDHHVLVKERPCLWAVLGA